MKRDVARRRRWLRALLYVVLSIISIPFLFPTWWMITSSFKTVNQIFAFPPSLIPLTPSMDAYKHPGEITFPLVREFVDDVVTVTDAEISQTIVQLLERSKAVVEGAGAVGLAALLAGKVRAKRAVAVLSGGNIDTPLLMQVIRFGLTNAGRYLVIRTRLIDRPGQLMRLLQVIADAHINLLVVSHHRESVDVAVAETGIELILETRDEAHAHEVIELVRSAGYPVTRMH